MLRDQKGVTLTELLVVAAIIMVLSAITIPNWNRGGERLKVSRAAHQLNQDIRRAQELTLANAECKKCRVCDRTTGYGLEFSKGTKYVLFGDCPGVDGVGNNRYDSGEVRETITLEKGVELVELTQVMDNSETHSDPTVIVFHPPEPTAIIGPQGITTEEPDQLIIELSNNGFCRKVKANRVGLVEIDRCNE